METISLPAEPVTQRHTTPGQNVENDTIENRERSEDEGAITIGARLRRLRLSVGLTQGELARRSGIKRPNIARLQAGRHIPSLETLGRLASAIGVPPARVFSRIL